MKWAEYKTAYQVYNKDRKLDFVDFYDYSVRNAESAEGNTQYIKLRSYVELMWYKSQRPYYNVWPCIEEALLHTSLEVPTKFLSDRVEAMAESGIYSVNIRTSVETSNSCFVVSFADMKNWSKKADITNELIICDPGILAEGVPVVERLYLDRGETIGGLISSKENRGATDKSDKRLHEFIAPLITAVLIFSADPDSELVTPVPLNKDEAKYELSGDGKFIDKARRRGKFEFDLGKNFLPEKETREVSTHVRRPYFGLRWTGKGRVIPKIVPIRGTIVKRNKMTEVPTGYLDKEGSDL